VGTATAVRERVWPFVEARPGEWLDEVLAVAAIPAPPFGEGPRAAHVEARFRALQLEGVGRDAAGNVLGVLPGEDRRRPPLLLAAHMDTVFPPETDVTPRLEGHRAYGPGIRDNAAGVAALISLARAFRSTGTVLPADLVLAATVGEEGLGNLRGMRALVAEWGRHVAAVLAIDGDLAGIVHVAVGSVRLRVVLRGPGGHSWGNFGRPSAVHRLAQCVADLCALPVPSAPRTSYNVGVIRGGLGVNAIAPEAEMLVDLRSVDPERLAWLEGELRRIVARRAGDGVAARVDVLGRRPAGGLERDHPLVRLVERAHREAGLRSRLESGSTDANEALAHGVPAVCVGVASGGGVHTPDEYLEVASVVPGLRCLTLAVALVMDEFRR
jgi:tripeptide aminopeptidase